MLWSVGLLQLCFFTRFKYTYLPLLQSGPCVTSSPTSWRPVLCSQGYGHSLLSVLLPGLPIFPHVSVELSVRGDVAVPLGTVGAVSSSAPHPTSRAQQRRKLWKMVDLFEERLCALVRNYKHTKLPRWGTWRGWNFKTAGQRSDSNGMWVERQWRRNGGACETSSL